MAKSQAGSADKQSGEKQPGEKQGRLSIIKQNYRMAREHDPKLPWILLATFFGITALFLIIGFAIGNWPTMLLIGLPLALLATTFIFSRRAMRAAYASIEGQPGAAVAIVQSMEKRGWRVTPAVNVTRNQDLVHRVVGRAGIVLIGEGQPDRVTNLLAAERKRTQRFAGEAPITDVLIGDRSGQVTIAKLQKHLTKMPKVLTGDEAFQLTRKLDAAMAGPPLPIPKGPMPKNLRGAQKSKFR